MTDQEDIDRLAERFLDLWAKSLQSYAAELHELTEADVDYLMRFRAATATAASETDSDC